MATKAKEYKAKNSWKKVIPFWVNDVVGKDNYKELQRGNTVSLYPELKRGIFEYLTEVAEAPAKKKASAEKGDE